MPSVSDHTTSRPNPAGFASDRVRTMIKDGRPQREVLNFLVAEAEHMIGGGAVASILVLDSDGLLRNGASPNLPADYLNAIDRLKPDARVGTCAAAAATGCVVITPDFCADSKWAELRHLPLALGFLGACSTPIKSLGGRILGTFGVYFRETRIPTTEELKGMAGLASAAAMSFAGP